MFKQNGEGLFPAWVLWVIGPVTVLAAALIILAVVLGIRAGQRQIDIQRRQQVGIALQRAVDFQNEGRLQDAVAEYRRVLILDPANEQALSGIQIIVDQATGAGVALPAPAGESPPAGESGAATPPPAVGVSAATPTPGADSAEEARFQQARAVYQSGQWREAVDQLLALRSQSPDFRREQVDEMLYNCYVTLAAESEQDGDLQAAVGYVDEALALRPNSTALRQARTLAANYVEALSLGTSDPATTVQLLEAIYLQDPQYRDVATRLQVALREHGDQLALEKEWCLAEEQYAAAIAIAVTPGSIARRDDLAERCEALEELIARGNVTPTPTRAGVTVATVAASVATATPATALATPEPDEIDDPPTTAPVVAPATGSVSGRILYSALDPVDGRSLIYLRGVAAGSQPSILFEGASQPAFRGDTQRLAFRNLREDSRGLSTIDPATGLLLRFTNFAEDVQPRWNAEGNLIAFASTREGDRRSRIYILWADVDNQANGMGFGTSPSWHPGADLLAYQGCDETGNRCGIWSMNGGGGDRRGLTSVPADTRPSWAPNGAFVAFMSEGRDGNAEIYRVDTAGGTVTRLTENAALDVSPSVSPDSAWVAFFSNRGGSWGVWAVPAAGGEAQLLFPVEGGLGDWTNHQLHWVN